MGVNGVSLGNKTFTEAVTLLKKAGCYCHLAVARFAGFLTVTVTVPPLSSPGDLILARCPDGTNVDVRIPPTLQPGSKFQLQIEQPQYDSEAMLLSNNTAKSHHLTSLKGGEELALQHAERAQRVLMEGEEEYGRVRGEAGRRREVGGGEWGEGEMRGLVEGVRVS